ncbi:ABC transporter permease [Geosporobacter ferrireducens]|uniref:ABC transporter permease n=1 Tax=Geosporobacter ferrireducens TaxID=1424294 RepID=A0A1D8GMJ1_9FIRM|nr:iron ABC transporter permease [Geosporobacter ferrireducens]AOT72100.1 ABC transporter permease [Geosporobacter ferrireducens]MTI55988.1 iron ABC transporter permease [Geosporobacter ferrireducens]
MVLKTSNNKLKIKTEVDNIKKNMRDPVLMITILGIIAIVFLFILYPLIIILKESLYYKNVLSLYHYKEIFRLSSTKEILWNTIYLGFIVSVISTAIGFLFAYASAYLKIRSKKIFNAIAILPMVSPPFVIALSTILLFGRNGFITRGILGMREANVYGLNGLILVQTLTFFPVAYLLLVGLLKSIDPSVEEAARDLGASRGEVFRSITLPLMVPGLANAFLLVFIQSIADFSNPMVIGGNYTTLAVQIYLQGIGNYDMGGGTALAIILLMISTTLFMIQKYYVGKKSYITVTGKASRSRELIDSPEITRPIYLIVLALSVFVGLMYILVPIGAFIKLWGADYSFSLNHFKYVINLGMKPIKDTTFLSMIATPISGILAMIIAFLIVRKKFIGKSFVEMTTMLALAIPGTVIGLGYVLSYNTKPLVLTGTATILIIAFVMRSMPIGIRAGIAALQQIDPSIEEAANVLGASSSKVFTSVTIPMIRPAFFSGLVYTFVRSMTLVSTVIFLVSARYNLLTAAIMNQIDVGKIGVASAYSTILILIVAVVVWTMQFILSKLGIDTSDIEG